ncbi:MAG: hypothetical protein DWI13_04505 [Planctomycetota bacterium]|nr:MAG: hypothetical protein DWI13_04505 [Planctomycetota bacterium]
MTLRRSEDFGNGEPTETSGDDIFKYGRCVARKDDSYDSSQALLCDAASCDANNTPLSLSSKSYSPAVGTVFIAIVLRLRLL